MSNNVTQFSYDAVLIQYYCMLIYAGEKNSERPTLGLERLEVSYHQLCM